MPNPSLRRSGSCRRLRRSDSFSSCGMRSQRKRRTYRSRSPSVVSWTSESMPTNRAPMTSSRGKPRAKTFCASCDVPRPGQARCESRHSRRRTVVRATATRARAGVHCGSRRGSEPSHGKSDAISSATSRYTSGHRSPLPIRDVLPRRGKQDRRILREPFASRSGGLAQPRRQWLTRAWSQRPSTATPPPAAQAHDARFARGS